MVRQLEVILIWTEVKGEVEGGRVGVGLEC